MHVDARGGKELGNNTVDGMRLGQVRSAGRLAKCLVRMRFGCDVGGCGYAVHWVFLLGSCGIAREVHAGRICRVVE